MEGKPAGGVIWDMDGTLVDTAELHFQAWADTCRAHGRGFTREEFAATFGRRNPEIIRQLFGMDVSEHDIHHIGDQKEVMYRSVARSGVELLPGARSLLEAIRAAEYAQAIGSSAPRANLELILELTGTAHLFTALATMEDTQRGKPDPQVFLIAAARLGLPPERCVVIEDAPAGVQAARAGGMRCVAVGFVGHHSVQRLYEAGADLVVKTLTELTVPALARLLA